ncbi:YccV-like-domain-containing protein [Westerdykella ornata]|uniref:YccV-like-domain-containing protein n=1 Tax=Westerdykella ornata TaxID=318751 RepID=A0A6A6JRI6_WESOR|nr:YccV-like-domain-containing protein [Westerdykella ornata]KAF2278336.1 YccV-like-domain-containing protein [Westerdykella ornata]
MPPNRTLPELPAEVLESVLLHLDAPSLSALSLTSKFLQDFVADAHVVWRNLCLTTFQFWDPRHDITAKSSEPLSKAGWRALFHYRIHVRQETRRLLNNVLQLQYRRVQHIVEAAGYGYDAKDTLLEEFDCPDDCEDVLARRYYAHAILGRIQRELAIKVWKDLSGGKDVPLERALSAFDMFALVGRDVDLNRTSAELDDLARRLLRKYPAFPDMSTRAKASTLGQFLHDQGFRGVSDESYRALRNSFIGLAMRLPKHESLPLISVAIYCAIASRVGLNARPCGFIFHVICWVSAPKSYTLDGEYKPSQSDELDTMYVDPFRGGDEVFKADLIRKLKGLAVPASQHAYYLSPSTTSELVIRTARNITASVQSVRQNRGPYQFGVHAQSWHSPEPDVDGAFYGAIWAITLVSGAGGDVAGNMPESSHDVETRRRQYLPYLLECFQLHFPWDITLLEEHAIPLFPDPPDQNRLKIFTQSMRKLDSVRKEVNRRPPQNDKVLFKVGQLFRHKRYDYEGVVTGWDPACNAGEDWIQHMGVDRLQGGRNQSFYHVLVDDKTVRYVAEENIEPVEPGTEPSAAMLTLAGRYFKRWDRHNNIFVSNVRDEYPDD